MSITNQINPNAVIQKNSPEFMDSSFKAILNSGLESSMSVKRKVFENFFQKVHKIYSGVNTTNIESLAKKILEGEDSEFVIAIRKKTTLSDTFLHRLIEAKTPLGEVFQELQYSQENPNRKLLSPEIFNEAEKEALELMEAKKKTSSNETILMSKRQSSKVIRISPEFLINTFTSGNQLEPSVASLNNNDFVVAWTSVGQDGSSWGIYGQILNANGTKSGGEFPVNTYTTDSQFDPSVATLSNGKFVVSWRSNLQDGDRYGVYAQMFNADGTKSGGEFRVNTYTTLSQMNPSVAGLSTGTFVVTWSSDGQDGSAYGIYGQIFTSTGSKSRGEFRVNTYTDNYQDIPSVAALSGGKFVVTWESAYQDGSFKGIYGQIFTSTGSKSGGEFRVNTFTANTQWISSVAALDSGRFVVTWVSSNQDGSPFSIFGQIFTSTGSKSGGEFPVNTYTTDIQSEPSVAGLNNDAFVITWQSNFQDGSRLGVYGQIFTSTGSKSGGEFLVNNYTTRDQASPAIARLSNDIFVVTWHSSEQDGSGYGIYGQIFEKTIVTSTVTSSSTSSVTSTTSLSSSSRSSSSSTAPSSSTASSSSNLRSSSGIPTSANDATTKSASSVFFKTKYSDAVSSGSITTPFFPWY